ncbi:SMI1/KNR4 family protein [Flavobacterium sp. MFBS3-15]|uniref:SMI1/KNR4 family protein n=1 Tax=Flavobacterium sp. MFBS3-15 TaxID=2989816 RepID=UPI0022355FE7|nr:SMI1/KNR4 family protein [Flavobacterium sp. MFBS3-15]MCW4469914.1 SMI1/KNR4 family protein [Flavobacterium sp. MFBS3-15]
MAPKKQLESILGNRYESEDGDLYKVELLGGMDDHEITNFKSQLPNNTLPDEIEQLLRFSRGFEFYSFEEIRFDTYGVFGIDGLFPRSIELAGDGFGNYWILDIDSLGNWNSVYYVCHDPAVVIKHSENLSEFIMHVDEYGKKGNESHLDIIHEKTVFEIWDRNLGVLEPNDVNFNFGIVDGLPELFIVADLINKPTNTGFSWAKHHINSKIIRPTDEPLWIIEKKVKQGLFARLFKRNN